MKTETKIGTALFLALLVGFATWSSTIGPKVWWNSAPFIPSGGDDRDWIASLDLTDERSRDASAVFVLLSGLDAASVTAAALPWRVAADYGDGVGESWSVPSEAGWIQNSDLWSSPGTPDRLGIRIPRTQAYAYRLPLPPAVDSNRLQQARVRIRGSAIDTFVSNGGLVELLGTSVGDY